MKKNIKQLQETRVKENILSVLTGGDILLISPPFLCVNYPSFSLHALQPVAEERGYKTEILYLNTLLASVINRDVAQALTLPSSFSYWKMFGERLFARSAYDLPPLGKSPEFFLDEAMSVAGNNKDYVKTSNDNEVFDLDTLEKIEATCKSFIDIVIPVIASLRYKIIGCTVQIGQTNAAIAILNGIKKNLPGIVTLIGGPNCGGEMAEGIASLSDSIDYIFSGESELIFSNFLQNYSKGQLPSQRIIIGEPIENLDRLSLPDYDTFFKQWDVFTGNNSPKDLSIIYQTSRGCSWGQKYKCSFCGIRDETFRKKTSSIAFEGLKELTERYPGRRIFMADNILPSSYHKELMPRLGDKDYSHLHYMIRTDIKLADIINLKAANVDAVSAGIEALSTGLLKLANKGVTARENLIFIRNICSVGIYLNWILIWGFPGDKASDYEESLRLIPLIRHFQPPREINHIQFERSSSYQRDPSRYRIRNFRPLAVYNMIYPERVNMEKMAYYFTADYPSESHTHPELIREIIDEWKIWKNTWKKLTLAMIPFMDKYIVYDNRNTDGKDRKHILEYQQAMDIMTTRVYKESETLNWALEEKLGVVVDSWYVPLVTASPELLLKFEKEACGD